MFETIKNFHFKVEHYTKSKIFFATQDLYNHLTIPHTLRVVRVFHLNKDKANNIVSYNRPYVFISFAGFDSLGPWLNSSFWALSNRRKERLTTSCV